MRGQDAYPAELFAPYRVTERTFFRPAFEAFEPRFRVSAEVQEDLRRIERLDQEIRHVHVDAEAARRLLFEALTKNAHGTASIEGNPLTEEEVESLLSRPLPEPAANLDEREILNYAAFIDRLPEWPEPEGPADVLDLHTHLFDGVMHDAGTFKERVNFVRAGGEVRYVPTHPDRVEDELARALQWMHDRRDVHPILRVSVFFHEFQGIHPFRDGNGRVGRALTTLLLHRLGYEGIRYCVVDGQFNADRDPYYGTLLEVEENGYDFTPWIAYMVRVLRTGYERALERFLVLRGLPANATELEVRVAEWFHRLRDRVVKFNDVHQAFPTIPDRTLRRALAHLSEAGVLDKRGVKKGTTYRLALPDTETP